MDTERRDEGEDEGRPHADAYRCSCTPVSMEKGGIG